MLGERGIGFLKWRRGPSMRLIGYPWRNVKSCSGHSPPLSHTGQSSGWLTSSNSRISARACTAIELCVFTTMPSATGVVQAVFGRVRDAAEVVELDLRPVVAEDALVHAHRPVAPHAARRALAARLVRVELQQPVRGAHDAVRVVHHDHAA